MHECGRLEHLDRACQVEHCTGLRTLFLLAVRLAGGQRCHDRVGVDRQQGSQPFAAFAGCGSVVDDHVHDRLERRGPATPRAPLNERLVDARDELAGAALDAQFRRQRREHGVAQATRRWFEPVHDTLRSWFEDPRFDEFD